MHLVRPRQPFDQCQEGGDHAELAAAIHPARHHQREFHDTPRRRSAWTRSEEHTSELQSIMHISYAVFCLKKKNNKHNDKQQHKNLYTTMTQNSKTKLHK